MDVTDAALIVMVTVWVVAVAALGICILILEADQRAKDEAAPTSFPSVHEVTFYQARCATCGYIEDDYGDYTAWGEFDSARCDVLDRDWIETDDDRLICPDCQTDDDEDETA